MPITSLRITDFRNLAKVEFEPCARGLNIICGDNGSGKTSLLEAIHYLGLGKSFRTSTSTRLISHESEKFSIFSQLVNTLNRDIPVGVERAANGSNRLRMAEKDLSSITELAYLLPIRVINSQSHHLFESGPAFRRKYLDWGLFYQTECFLMCWRQFERVLKQRNALLQERRPRQELEVWSNELSKQGLEFDQYRREYVQALAPLILEMATELLGIENLDIRYQCGWDESKDYASVLQDSYLEEMRFGHTQFGPHRADLDITINGLAVKHFLSRGQQKLLICAMILAQGVLLAKCTDKALIYLVDDLPAELDLQSRQKLLALLSRQSTQIFITAIERDLICDLIADQPEVPIKVFHVEHGSVKELERSI